MKKRIHSHFVGLVGILFVLACQSPENNSVKQDTKATGTESLSTITAELSPDFNMDYLQQDNINIRFFTYTSSSGPVIGEDGTPATFNIGDLDTLNHMLKLCVGRYNLEQEKEYLRDSVKHPEAGFSVEDFVIILSRYARQYIAYFNEAGDRIVWINCYCLDPGTEPATYIVDVLDGGNCYFNLKVNLTKMEYYDFHVNGWA